VIDEVPRKHPPCLWQVFHFIVARSVTIGYESIRILGSLVEGANDVIRRHFAQPLERLQTGLRLSYVAPLWVIRPSWPNWIREKCVSRQAGKRRRGSLECEKLEQRTHLATIQNFDVSGDGTDYLFHQFTNASPPQLLPGGPTGNGEFLRLVSADAQTPSMNSVTFSFVDFGGFGLGFGRIDEIVSDFDFRMVPGRGRGDGFSFAMLETSEYGLDYEVPSFGEEPNFRRSLGIGFDILENDGVDVLGNDIIRPDFNNSISVHFDEALVPNGDVDVTPLVDLAGGQWIHARIIVRLGAPTADVTVQLKACIDDELITVIDRLPVPGLGLYSGRVHFGARSNLETADHDIDNIYVQYTSTSESLISLSSPTYTALENQGFAEITVKRTGNLNKRVGVDFETRDMTALAGLDYGMTRGTIFYDEGVTSRTISVSIVNDGLTESDEVLKVVLSNPVNAVLTGPEMAGLFIRDDEISRTGGQWDDVACWPIVPIHATLLPTGRVMFWDRLENLRLWDPISSSFSTPALPDYNLFASGHTLDADGSLIVTGGHLAGGHPFDNGIGLSRASRYDPARNTWQDSPDMNAGRWYATNTVLGSGDVLAISGSTTRDFFKNDLPQVWQPATQSWRSLTGAESNVPLGFELYPRMFLAPDGRVFKAGPDNTTWFLDTSGDGSWTPGPPSNSGHRSNGTAVMFRPGRILTVGGNDPPVAAAEVIDLNEPNPVWRTIAPPAFARRQLNATLLPDGKVLISGGTSGDGFNDERRAVLPAELWDPETERWSIADGLALPRTYQSTALLLPDGRVMAAGGGQGAAAGSSLNNAEIFSPPYLFKGPRPTIADAPPVAYYGDSIFLRTNDATSIAKVSLIRLGAVSHAFDQNQRFAELSFSLAPGGLTLGMPSNSNLLPPGDYMLFILNGQGVPSVAHMIKIVEQSIEFTAASYEAEENAGTVQINVVRRGNPVGEVSVKFAITNGTATAGSDYSATDVSVTWSDGEAEPKLVEIPILQDSRVEGDETVALRLTNLVGRATLGTFRDALLTIRDDDGIRVAFRSADSSGSERTRSAKVTVMLTEPATRDVFVDYALSGGTATGNGVDHRLSTGRVQFRPGQVFRFLTIPIVNDKRHEADETILVTLTGSTNANLGIQRVHTYTIIDNDPLRGRFPPVAGVVESREFRPAADSVDRWLEAELGEDIQKQTWNHSKNLSR